MQITTVIYWGLNMKERKEMKWSNPELVNLGQGVDAELLCTHGITPKWLCSGGAVDEHTCDRGGHAPICETGYGGAV